MKCCYSKLIGYTRGAVTIKGAVIYQSLRYILIPLYCCYRWLYICFAHIWTATCHPILVLLIEGTSQASTSSNVQISHVCYCVVVNQQITGAIEPVKFFSRRQAIWLLTTVWVAVKFSVE